MVSGLISSGYSSTFADSPESDVFEIGKRYWWCHDCGAVFRRHHMEIDHKFCYNCEQRDAVLIEMRPIGPGAESFGRGDTAEDKTRQTGRDDHA